MRWVDAMRRLATTPANNHLPGILLRHHSGYHQGENPGVAAFVAGFTRARDGESGEAAEGVFLHAPAPVWAKGSQISLKNHREKHSIPGGQVVFKEVLDRAHDG